MEQPFLRTILLATDGSPDSALAARASADLASLTRAALHVVYDWSLPSAAAYPYPAVPEGYADLYREEAQALLASAVEHLKTIGAPVTEAHLRTGQPVDQILALAEEIGADIVVAGSRGHGALGRLVLGSVAEGLVHNAHCPVLIVRGGDRAWPPERVIAGDDGSDDARQAAALAFRIGGLFGASGTLVNVLPDAPIRLRSDVARHQQVVEQASTSATQRAAELEQFTGYRPETLIRTGDAANELVTLAAESPNPLIAVGKRGLGRLARLRLGSVSTKVLHAATGPVLIGASPSGSGTGGAGTR